MSDFGDCRLSRLETTDLWLRVATNRPEAVIQNRFFPGLLEAIEAGVTPEELLEENRAPSLYALQPQ